MRESGKAWWEPVRPRMPKNILRPKIVSPHLALVPRFAIDQDGQYTVTRSPFLYPKEDILAEQDVLKYFVAVLNSTPCFWYIAAHSHKYRANYIMLESNTLLDVPVPDPKLVDPIVMRNLLNLVEERLAARGSATIVLDRRIDWIVGDLYMLSHDERQLIGMEQPI